MPEKPVCYPTKKKQAPKRKTSSRKAPTTAPKKKQTPKKKVSSRKASTPIKKGKPFVTKKLHTIKKLDF